MLSSNRCRGRLEEIPEPPSDVESLSDLINNFLESLTPLLRFFALASMPSSAEAFRKAFEDWKLYFQQQDKVLLAFTIQHGLIGVERLFTDEQLWLLIRWTVEHGDSVVNRRLHEFLSLKEIEAIVNSWATIPYLMARKKICGDALEAYRMGFH